MNTDLTKRIHHLLAQVVVDDAKGLFPDDNLFKLGILDSVLLIELVEKIESEFAISVEDRELSPDFFLSISRIDLFIRHKLSREGAESPAKPEQ